jgi:hypothetical protein
MPGEPPAGRRHSGCYNPRRFFCRSFLKFDAADAMSLLIRINLVLGVVSACAACVALYACWTILEGNARREVLAEAGLMMESAVAMRAYTASEILPLIEQRMQDSFLPQGIPFYAATQNFLKLRARHPDYTYKEATLNPTNPRDRAADWEADIIQRFRNDEHAQEFIGERETPVGKSLYLARPIRDLAAEEFPPNGPSEIASLVRSFNRMRTSLDKAMRLLDRSA